MARQLSIPRDGSQIFGLLIALIGVAFLPFFFMFALSQSADVHPHHLKTSQAVQKLTRPLASARAHLRALL